MEKTSSSQALPTPKRPCASVIVSVGVSHPGLVNQVNENRLILLDLKTYSHHHKPETSSNGYTRPLTIQINLTRCVSV